MFINQVGGNSFLIKMNVMQDVEGYLMGLDPSSLLSLYFSLDTPTVSPSQVHERAGKRSMLVVPERIREYVLRGVIGAGAFGHCYASEGGASGEKVVVKVGAKGLKYGVGREGVILRHLQAHSIPNIIHLHEAFPLGNVDVMIMEYAESGDLTTFYENDGLTREERVSFARCIIRDMANALNAMHGLGIVHRDIRPGNIVLCRGERGEMVAKLIDFGTAVDITREGCPMDCVPSSFSAPELEEGDEVDLMACDVYALGAIWYSLVEMELYESRMEGHVLMDEMLSRMLRRDPKQRPMMHQVHKYLSAQNNAC
jgi:serine/threonine protein kinase